MYESYEQWFDCFYERVNQLGYHGPVDRGTFESDFENGIDPYNAAKDFVIEMNES
jgi:hypothetical protein